jgi:hypothetical protein
MKDATPASQNGEARQLESRAWVSPFVCPYKLVMLLILGRLHDLAFVPESYFWENFCCIFAPEVELTHGY